MQYQQKVFTSYKCNLNNIYGIIFFLFVSPNMLSIFCYNPLCLIAKSELCKQDNDVFCWKKYDIVMYNKSGYKMSYII